MDFLNKIKGYLGFDQPDQSSRCLDLPSTAVPTEPQIRENPDNWSPQRRSFNIFTDPLEIHKYFEQQMSDMLRSFGFEEFGSNGFDFHVPEIEEEPKKPPSHLRDQYLKPGYERREKTDENVDGKLNMSDIYSIFDGSKAVMPFEDKVEPYSHYYGQSMSTKTIRNPDGSIETYRTVRDNEGNEETTITRKVGNKEHTIFKKRDKNGKEEVVENLMNLEEKDIGTFFPEQQPLEFGEQPHENWFDKFFR